jgi:hypothetical protein
MTFTILFACLGLIIVCSAGSLFITLKVYKRR